MKTSLHMSVATAPSIGVLHLQGEIRQSQAALLYADSVTLISPRASLVHSIAVLEDAADLDMLELLVQVAPVYAPNAVEPLDSLLRTIRSYPAGNQLTSPQRRERRNAIEQMFDGMRPAINELQDRVREGMAEYGYHELALAMRAGLLTLDPLPDVDVGQVGNRPDEDVGIANRYFARVREALTSGVTYPLFDHATSNLVNLGVEAGIFSPVPAARRRGRDAALANGLFDRLPNFEHATMSEILDIRQELHAPLHRFRQGVREITKDIDTAPEDPQFAHEIEDAWTIKVAPALDEIENAINENTSLSDLVRRTVLDPGGQVAAGGLAALGVAVGPASGIPAAVALMLTGAAATVGGGGLAAARSILAQRAAVREATEAQFYFLYGTNRRIRPGSS
ncbi:hypothetical protein [Rhodococcus sp. 11-3]|uniref:hypothetical protein n=1 Tax=Rhodococcus sp. 11-3 TaxID=2854796 RepID=UPI00203B7B23|nr:hypothetical protein [Rhodococcus sp. 11-3]USC16194.1 hypothetical protein KZJ41_04515 [Rhodococcus sp. 11-3]